ncbi:hypothetical protein PInf_004415 [Phytophthora infestans]|nr:hypothetical protein PInf_004415 [Phytophthora infestans]
MELESQSTTDEDQDQEQCDDHLHQTVVAMVAATTVIVTATATTAVATVLGVVAADGDAGEDKADGQAQLICHEEYDTGNAKDLDFAVYKPSPTVAVSTWIANAT